MATSGVKVSDDVYETFQAMKMAKKYRCMLMEIKEGFIVKKGLREKTDDQRKDFDEFVASLTTEEACFAVLDLTVPSTSGGKGKEVLFYVSWCPNTAEVHKRVLYATSKKAFTSKINEALKEVQANDITDLEYEDVLTK